MAGDTIQSIIITKAWRVVFIKDYVFVVDDNDDDLTHNSRLLVLIVQKKSSNIPETHTHTRACTLSADYSGLPAQFGRNLIWLHPH